MRISLVAAFFLLAGSASAQTPPPAFETKAAVAYMIEASTGTVLLAKNEEKPFSPASLSKLMTLDVVFDALKRGEVTADTTYLVSENAWRTGGAPSRTSTMFAALKSHVRVGDLVQGIAIQQANDACIVLAEGISVSETAFARRMTEHAREIGMKSATFGNSTGLPDADSKVTAHDMVTLALDLQSNYPDLYKSFSQPDFTWSKIFQRNRNPMLPLSMGVDGLGIGFAENEGYSIVASIERDGRRLFLALGGLGSEKERTEETKRVLEWGLSNFKSQRIFAEGEVIGAAGVYGGEVSRVGLVANMPVDVYVPVNNPDRLSARVIYRWPLSAPVESGYRAGTLKIFSGTKMVREVPLFTDQAVTLGGLTRRALDAFVELSEGLVFSWLWDTSAPA
jgi:serine-type D-Ala-D-Ala carboxypeptidase (penicillin-binding protein 5/6)